MTFQAGQANTVVARLRMMLFIVVGMAAAAACSGGADPADPVAANSVTAVAESDGADSSGGTGSVESSSGVVIEPLTGIDFDDIQSRADIWVDDLSDGLVGAIIAGDCFGAYDWFASINFAEAVPYEAFESEVCSRLVGAQVIRVYRGEPIPIVTGHDTTSGYQVGDELLLFTTYTSQVSRTITAFDWANEPRDLSS